MTERVLCVIAHPDDELSCGGTLAKHVAAGDVVMIAALSDGVGSRGPQPKADSPVQLVAGTTDIVRRREFLAAIHILGVTQNAFASHPDNQFDSVPLLIINKDIEGCCARFEPTVVYTHWAGDMNVDHQAVSNAVSIACRPQPGSPVKRVLQFEVPCNTTWSGGFSPTYFVDISDHLDAKLRAAKCYASEMREFPHPRSIRGMDILAAIRGMTIGVEAAEAFVVQRMIA